ncbi:MAG: capsular polysaccharide biosynthesis protein [Marinosulfonomonas sp.]|nr:capsular polysaccharide biosynthesis protein [Marinosulfonomonas sp.]
MPITTLDKAAGNTPSRRLFVYNGGFLTQTRIRRILDLSGWHVSLGKPGSTDDCVGVWGKSPTSPRGEGVAERTDAPILRVEDSFLRSVLPGRDGSAPIGLNLDKSGVHFDSSRPSDLEDLLATHPLDDTAILDRARAAAIRLADAHISKYNAYDPGDPVPDAPYVLVIDQTKDDAAIAHGGANAATFKEMLVFAQTEHPGSRVVIKSHPETAAGHRAGHFGPDDVSQRVHLVDAPVSPWKLMQGATAVYTVSSQLGFEAIFAGHRPRVFGQPFYAGWGLTQDEYPVARRQRTLTRAQLFAAAMILYPTWYDPCRDQLCELEDVIDQLEAEARAWRDDHQGYVAAGIRAWKRPHMRRFFGADMPLQFARTTAGAQEKVAKSGQKPMIWASDPAAEQGGWVRIEDGFLRSRGLGARLIPPLSLVRDDLGIYYDPTQESRLEQLIAASPALPGQSLERARRLQTSLRRAGLSKYNLDGEGLPELPIGPRILVPGQVEDDASIEKGCDAVRTNLELLARTRAENPDAVIIYKPHPDVQAGLRKGALDDTQALEFADVILPDVDPVALIEAVDSIWTMTSLMGFEALIRGKPVTCLGMPFYAGWGLTRDLGVAAIRRAARPSLDGLVHATLIGYARYNDPISGLPCPVEVIVDRLQNSDIPLPGPVNRIAALVQGILPNKLFRR